MKFSASFVLAALPFLAAVSALPAHPKPGSGEEAPAGGHVEKPAEDDGPFVIPEQFKGVHIADSVLAELKAHPNEMYYLYEDGTGKDVEQENKFLEYLIKNAVEDVVKKAIKKPDGEPEAESGERHRGHGAKHLEPREPEEPSETPTLSATPARRPRVRTGAPGGSRRRGSRERAALKRTQRRREGQGVRTRPTSRRTRQGQLQRGTGARCQRQSMKTSATQE